MPIINTYLLRLYLQMKPYILPLKKYMICQDFNEEFIYRIMTCKIVRLQKLM